MNLQHYNLKVFWLFFFSILPTFIVSCDRTLGEPTSETSLSLLNVLKKTAPMVKTCSPALLPLYGIYQNEALARLPIGLIKRYGVPHQRVFKFAVDNPITVNCLRIMIVAGGVYCLLYYGLDLATMKDLKNRIGKLVQNVSKRVEDGQAAVSNNLTKAGETVDAATAGAHATAQSQAGAKRNLADGAASVLSGIARGSGDATIMASNLDELQRNVIELMQSADRIPEQVNVMFTDAVQQLENIVSERVQQLLDEAAGNDAREHAVLQQILQALQRRRSLTLEALASQQKLDGASELFKIVVGEGDQQMQMLQDLYTSNQVGIHTALNTLVNNLPEVEAQTNRTPSLLGPAFILFGTAGLSLQRQNRFIKLQQEHNALCEGLDRATQEVRTQRSGMMAVMSAGIQQHASANRPLALPSAPGADH